MYRENLFDLSSGTFCRIQVVVRPFQVVELIASPWYVLSRKIKCTFCRWYVMSRHRGKHIRVYPRMLIIYTAFHYKSYINASNCARLYIHVQGNNTRLNVSILNQDIKITIKPFKQKIKFLIILSFIRSHIGLNEI